MEFTTGFSTALLCSAVALFFPGCATACEYQLLRPSVRNDGYITSPNYPHRYTPGFCIMWMFYGRSGIRINMRLLDVDIPSYSDSCNNDFLMIGPVNERIYCGSIDRKSFPGYEAELTVSQNWLFVVFNSTSVGIKGRGFKIYYQLTITTAMTSRSASSTSTTPSLNPLVRSNIDMTSCQFVLPNEVGEISSNRTVIGCLEQTRRASWIVYSPGSDDTGVGYRLIFQHCYLPYPDIMKIYDGHTIGENLISSIKRTCPRYLVTPHHGFHLEYIRLSAGELPNFRIQYVLARSPQSTSTALPTAKVSTQGPIPNYTGSCIFHLSDPAGEIKSQNLMYAVQNTGYCSWLLHINSSGGQDVIYTLEFAKFHLSSRSIFMVHDGADRRAPILGPPFSNSHPLQVASSHNSIFIYYFPGSKLNLMVLNDIFDIKFNTVVKCPPGYEPCGYREFICFMKENRCDGVWHCPLFGGDERGCTAECPDDFSCDFKTSNCYNENDRCNGKGACPNYVDETSCREELCSAEKGLFLCRNRRCIYEKWRCDRLNDCFDNSDEENCSYLSSPQVVVAAAIGSLICALLLVITIGCVCKVYHLRSFRLRAGPSHETPLSRQLAEMFHQRAPPPPYHEAMLTSRPYSEAYLELLNHAESQSGESSEDNSPTSPDEARSQRNRINTQGLNEGQLMSQVRTGTTESDTLPLFFELFEQDAHIQHSLGEREQHPPHTETSTPVRSLQYSNSPINCSVKNEDFLGGFHNLGCDETHADGALLVHLASLPSADISHTLEPLPAYSGLYSRNHSETRIYRADDPKADVETGDFLAPVCEEDGFSIQEHTGNAYEDSDCDCILAENISGDLSNDETESDTECILGHV